ncbi:kinase-like domain-containing protein [Aspergillus coremiiformis]|uniref:Kinase-like domain-containing protein n=1 Tax=Aspergillus coremiiformis TaxID=138285 RepID=A0A5N6ZF51_9EURO|nr:kinase-like domain-containing protein [Aspergillus coremiiformis]
MAKQLCVYGSVNNVLFRFPPVLRQRRPSPARHLSTASKIPESSDLFEYTSGRWIYNDALRHCERRRSFNVSELKRLAASSVQQRQEDIVSFEKLAEGGFNRSFLITMRDGFRFVARIPYPVTEPKFLVIASEVATMDLLRSHGIPVPKILGYSPRADNSAGTEYIFMEFVQGKNLGDIWYCLAEKERAKIVERLVQLESQLFALRFPSGGSIYYTDDLPDQGPRIHFPGSSGTSKGTFCIGPDTSLGLWYGRRVDLNCLAALTAGAKKEIAYLQTFGRPLQPFQRLRREIYNYQVQSHLEHIDTLEKYLQIAPHLIPRDEPALHRPVVRHPDLQPNNIFVSDELEITGLIDWQHSVVLPFFLQCGIPGSLQNYGDNISASLQTPTLPRNFDDLEEIEQLQQAELFRRRQLHYLYVKMTADMCPEHYNALTHDFSMLRRRLFHHASDPWEGDNVTLKADLVNLSRKWTEVTRGAKESCPIAYSDDESAECLRLDRAQSEADEQFQACKDVIGVGTEGWVPVTQYEESKRMESKLKAEALHAAETDKERAIVQEHWIFDDFCEEDYM